MESIVIGKYHYIRNGDGREELFDIVVDPWETTNLTGSVRYAAALVAARSALDAAERVGKDYRLRQGAQQPSTIR